MLTHAGEQRRRTAADSVDDVERTLAAALPAGGAVKLITLLSAATDALQTQSQDAAA